MDFEDKKPKKKLTPNQATIKAQLSCAYQERCQQEMRDKLYEWGLYSNDVENIIANLISDNYLNEERFAKAYAGGKLKEIPKGKQQIRNYKAAQYTISRGFEGDLVWEEIKQLESRQ